MNSSLGLSKLPVSGLYFRSPRGAGVWIPSRADRGRVAQTGCQMPAIRSWDTQATRPRRVSARFAGRPRELVAACLMEAVLHGGRPVGQGIGSLVRAPSRAY